MDKKYKHDFISVTIKESHYIKPNNKGNGTLKYRLTIFIHIISPVM